MTPPEATRNVIVHYTEPLLAKKIPGIIDSACLHDVGGIIEPLIKLHIQEIYGLCPDHSHIDLANIFYGSREYCLVLTILFLIVPSPPSFP